MSEEEQKPVDPEQPAPEKPEEEEETHPYQLSWDGDAIVHLTDVGLLQDDLLYDYGIELTDVDCRKVLAHIVKNYVQEDKPLDKIVSIVHELFPERFKRIEIPKGPIYPEKKEPEGDKEEPVPEPEPTPEPEPEPEPEPGPEPGPSTEEGGADS